MKINSRGYVDTGFVRYITKEEFKKIDKDIEKNVYSPSMFWCLKVLTRTGLRVSDVVSLNISELKNNFRLIDKVMQKTQKPVRIPLPKDLSDGLRKYWYKYKHRMKEGYLFFANYSNTSENLYLSRNSVSLKLKQICRRVNLVDNYYTRRNGQKQSRISPHTFRAFFIWRVSETSSMRMAQQLVGHENINQTAKYVNALALADKQNEVIENAFDF